MFRWREAFRLPANICHDILRPRSAGRKHETGERGKRKLAGLRPGTIFAGRMGSASTARQAECASTATEWASRNTIAPGAFLSTKSAKPVAAQGESLRPAKTPACVKSRQVPESPSGEPTSCCPERIDTKNIEAMSPPFILPRASHLPGFPSRFRGTRPRNTTAA